ncbi:MAG: hypothetical protein R6W93_13960, partial [Candidatus Limnocylindrales bacterium]
LTRIDGRFSSVRKAREILPTVVDLGGEDDFLNAFRADRIRNDHGLAAEAGAEGKAAVDALRAAGQAPWYETMAQAKELGGVDIQACSLSMDVLAIEEKDLDPLVDGVEGVTAFYLNAGDGQMMFI